MYRLPPSNALFQGDVILTLLPRLDRDPRLVTTAGKGRCEYCSEPLPVSPPPECGSCHAPVTVPPPPEACANAACGQAIRVRGQSRQTPLKQRLERGERLFSKGHELAVTNVEAVAAMILSQTCDIDQKDFINLAVVSPLAPWREDQKEMLRAKERGEGEGNFSLFYLADHERLPEAVVNLDRTFHVEASSIGERKTYRSAMRHQVDQARVPFVEVVDERLVSLDRDALHRLQLQMVQHILHPNEASEIEFDPPPANLLQADPDQPAVGTRSRRGWPMPLPKWLAERNPPRAYEPAPGGGR